MARKKEDCPLARVLIRHLGGWISSIARFATLVSVSSPVQRNLSTAQFGITQPMARPVSSELSLIINSEQIVNKFLRGIIF